MQFISARRKFIDLHVADKNQIAGQAVEYMRQLYEVEREAKALAAPERYALRQAKAHPTAEALHQWMQAYRLKVLNGTATAKALDYSLKRWVALIRYLDDGELPIDNNRVENLIRPWALGRSNWLLRGFVAQWTTRRQHHESDPVGQAERARSLCLSEGCAGAVTDSESE